MIHELTQRFFFEAAHTLSREVEIEASRRIHGHTYLAEVTVAGVPEAASGMVQDLGQFRATIARVKERLDHRMLDEVEGLGPPTLENLCTYLWKAFASEGCAVEEIRIHREASGDSCRLRRR